MLNDLLYIVWDADPVMFTIGGFELRYYGLMWALTFLIGERFFTNYVKREGFGSQIVETGFIWIVLGAVLGPCADPPRKAAPHTVSHNPSSLSSPPTPAC